MHQLKQIRQEIGLSIGDMATVLGLKKATLQCYENGSRGYPEEIMMKAREQLQRTRDYWAGMDDRLKEPING